ncbi:sensor histidine kinase [Aeromicrobium sp.]|uniref:sensor histidine kinase n=1 Tax=Aeromicrobium sp. TaxID=1871063 RepID=UPI003D6BF28C
MDTSAGLLIAGVIGATIGALVTWLWRYSERREGEVPEVASTVPPGAEAVLSVLSSSAVIVDVDDTVLQASAPAVAMGLVRDERLPGELMDLVQQVRRDGEIREAEVRLEHRRGNATTHVHARVAPLTSRLVVVLADDRTQAERVEAIRRDFVANVSHELKTPIGALNLLAEAVEEARDDPDAVTRFAGRMQSESLRLTRLVQQIIDLSRLQNDAISEEAAVVKVEELVAEATEHSATEAERKGIEIATSIAPDLLVHGDRGQLYAAVSNLVENAVTYSPAESRVAVMAERSEDDVRITVADHGIGIPGDEIDRIFERFYRVDPARARNTGGTGLGLSIVKHVAASNGGSVEVWSEPGSGSTFTLVLPSWSHELDDGELP